MFSGYGVGVFVCHTRAPWREFPRLRAALERGDGEPKWEIVHDLEDALIRSGHFEHADPEMVALVKRHERTLPSGQTVIDVPEGLRPDPPEDMFLAMRRTLSKDARRRLAEVLDELWRRYAPGPTRG